MPFYILCFGYDSLDYGIVIIFLHTGFIGALDIPHTVVKYSDSC